MASWYTSRHMDFIAIGDTVADEFIKLKDARVTCDINDEHCTISMRWGDKIPYDSAEIIVGVGNAANAAVAAARLGLSTGFVSNVGDDAFGTKTLEVFRSEGIDTRYVAVNAGIPTNHHYVLMYESERTILIRHEVYPYVIPEGFEAPKWIYLSSAGKTSTDFHLKLAEWLTEHPETKLAFQPGTYQIDMGKETLAPLYRVSEVIACNKEEAERILGVGSTDIKELLKAMHELGPKTVLITDGPKGAYAYDGSEMLKVPMYPDPAPPTNRTGAGDATTSSFVVALALGKSVREALLWGPVNSMSVTQHLGAQRGLLTREKLEEYLSNAPADYQVTAL